MRTIDIDAGEATPKTAPVKFSELADALMFTDAAGPYESRAYLCTKTGQIFLVSDLTDIDETPEDLEEADHYIEVPDKRDLDLGRRLALSFVSQKLPEDLDDAQDFFHHKGAYRRFRQLLERRRVLQAWYDYEASATEKALRQWCEDNGIQVSDG